MPSTERERAVEAICAEMGARGWRVDFPAQFGRDLRAALEKHTPAPASPVPVGESPACPKCRAAMLRETYEADDGDYTVPPAPDGAFYWSCPDCGHEIEGVPVGDEPGYADDAAAVRHGLTTRRGRTLVKGEGAGSNPAGSAPAVPVGGDGLETGDPAIGPTHPALIDAHVCLECGAVWDRETNCPFNGADSPTVPADEIGRRLLDAEMITGDELRALRSRLRFGKPDVESQALRSALHKLDDAERHGQLAARLSSTTKEQGDAA